MVFSEPFVLLHWKEKAKLLIRVIFLEWGGYKYENLLGSHTDDNTSHQDH